MASSSDPHHRKDSPLVKKQQNAGPAFKFLVPLIYAPVLPLIRITLRHKPVVRDRLFTLVLAGAFAHGFYLVYLTVRSAFFLLDERGGYPISKHHMACETCEQMIACMELIPDAYANGFI